MELERAICADTRVEKDNRVPDKAGKRGRTQPGSYMREIATQPNLDREEEQVLALELKAARESLAAVFVDLPRECRVYVLEGDADGPDQGCKWPLVRLEACYGRLSAFRGEHDDSRVEKSFSIAVREKRRLDRARDALVVGHLRLVPAVVSQINPQHRLTFLDLVQEGNLGLLEAVDRFDPGLGYRFSTYAFWWVRKAIFKALEEKSRVIRLPGHVVELERKLRAATRELESMLGRGPTPIELSERMALPVGKVNELLSMVRDPHPLESFGADSDAPSYHRQVADARTPSPLDATLSQELKNKMGQAMRVLGPREKTVIGLRFGINREQSHSLREVGRMLNVSRERIRQIESAALTKIQAAMDQEVSSR